MTRSALIALFLFLWLVPVWGQSATDLYGVIEIGGKGVKASVFQLTKDDARQIENDTDENDEGLKYKRVADWQKESFPEDNTEITSRENIDKTIAAVKKFFNLIKDERSVNPANIFVVASSGAARVPHFAEFQRRLDGAALGIKAEVISPAYECELMFRWIVPKYRYGDAVVIDVGSGSVNACYMEPDLATFRSFALLPYGTTRFAAMVTEDMQKRNAASGNFKEAAQRLRTAIVEPELDRELGLYPGLAKRSRLYLAGGIVWVTSTIVHPEHVQKPWIYFPLHDIKVFSNRLDHDRVKLSFVDFSRIPLGLDEKKAKAQEIVSKALTTFKPEQLTAGVELLQAMEIRLKWSSKKNISFANIARDAWRSQYLLNKLAADAGNDKQ